MTAAIHLGRHVAQIVGLTDAGLRLRRRLVGGDFRLLLARLQDGPLHFLSRQLGHPALRLLDLVDAQQLVHLSRAARKLLSRRERRSKFSHGANDALRERLPGAGAAASEQTVTACVQVAALELPTLHFAARTCCVLRHEDCCFSIGRQ